MKNKLNKINQMIQTKKLIKERNLDRDLLKRDRENQKNRKREKKRKELIN